MGDSLRLVPSCPLAGWGFGRNCNLLVRRQVICGSEAQPPWGTAGGRALGDGWGSERSRKPNDGAGLGTRKACDGVRIGSVSERLGVGSVREQKEIPDRSQGSLTYAATGSAAGAVVVSGWAAWRGLVTPAMKRSTSLVALSRERQG
jgi:hypothetical protein